MAEITIVSIVEGHGEVDALPVLIRRVVQAHNPQVTVHALRPIRIPRSKLLKKDELEHAVTLAAYKVSMHGGILLVLDADDDCPAELGPQLLSRAKAAVPGGKVPSSVVVAKREFEAWFLAAAESLGGKRGLHQDIRQPPDPEAVRDAKGWLTERMSPGVSYSEVIDQPAFAALMDLTRARAGAPSFDKLYRELTSLVDSLLPTAATPEADL